MENYQRNWRAGERRKFAANVQHFHGNLTMAVTAGRFYPVIAILAFVFSCFFLSHAASAMTVGGVAMAFAVPSAPAKMSPAQVNALQRQAVLSTAVEMTQQISSQVYNPATSGPINIVPRNVGLLKKFIIEISGTAVNSDAGNDATLTDVGLANLINSISFTDLNNNTRVQTTGFHLHTINNAKERKSYAEPMVADFDAASTTWPIIVAPATVPKGAPGANTPYRMVFELPIVYSDHDLRGAIYLNVVNAVAQLQITLAKDAQAFVAAGVDDTFAVWSGTATATIGSAVTVTVYQVYLDQLPVSSQGVILPVLDLSTVYELKSSNFRGLSATQDYPIPYANFRDFLSTLVIYNNDGVTRVTGTDLNYIALQSANFTNLWKIDPLLAAQFANRALNVGLPKGCYYFDSRRKPISTTQYGNMELVLNPITAGNAAYAFAAWEDFALVNTLQRASSLPGGGQ
jgi:hypothetical protein